MKKLILLWVIVFSTLSLKIYAQLPEIEPDYIKQVNKLAKSKLVKKAFEIILNENDNTLDDLITLTEIPAPPFMEEKRAEKFAGMLTVAGADSIWTDSEGNVLALRKGKGKGGKTIALDAHLDTVFPPETDVTVKIKGDTLFAPGIGDDTRGLAMVIAVLRALEMAEIETEHDVLFIGTTGEEGLGDLRGVKHLFSKDGPGIDTWISIDGGAIGRVNSNALGSYRYRVTFNGPGGHSWGAFGLPSPQHALGTAIHYFTKSADEFTKSGPKTSYNVGRIGGGTSVNSIAFESWMEIDMRSVSPEHLDQIDEILKAEVYKALDYHNSIKRSGPDLTVEIEKIGERPSGDQPVDLPLVQRSLAVVKHFGVEPRITRGSTNSNIPISLGIPAVTIGRGGKGSGGHSLGEWWIDDDGYQAIQLALLTLLSEAGISN